MSRSSRWDNKHQLKKKKLYCSVLLNHVIFAKYLLLCTNCAFNDLPGNILGASGVLGIIG